MGSLLIIRHGETKWNKAGRYQGQLDIPLSSTGIEQGKLLAKGLNKSASNLKAIYSSDLVRAADTAAFLAEAKGIPIFHDQRLREFNFGDWEGLTRQQIRDDYSEIYQQRRQNPETTPIPGGESSSEVQKRAMMAITEIVHQHPSESVAVISHGGTIRTMLCAILQVPLSQTFRFRVKNTSISRISYHVTADKSLEWVIEYINDFTHLA